MASASPAPAAYARFVALLTQAERQDESALASFRLRDAAAFLEHGRAVSRDLKKAAANYPAKNASKQWELADYYAACVTYTSSCVGDLATAAEAQNATDATKAFTDAEAATARAKAALHAYLDYVK